MIKQSSSRLMLRRFMPLIKGAAAGLCALIALTLLSAVCYNIAGAPEGTDVILAYITAGLAAGIGGMFCAAANGRDGLLWGALAGLELFVIFLAGAIISQSFEGGALIGKLLLCVICAAIGGVIGVNKFAK
ncbi:MAG: TIGR04086 family membrane protein [Eubacterium sp.]|nr:TIGR04086 family membrane protein [Eubacterium sp.]